MQLDHEFTVPIPAAQAWEVLLDIARIAPCLPGAVIDTVTEDRFTGRVKVLVGPISVSYAGEGRFVERDEAARRVRIEAGGKQTRGSGTAKATISAQLHDQGDSTWVTVQTELSITGKPAQFGRGVMADVGGKLLGQFADCLAERLAGSPEAPPAPAPSPPDESLSDEAQSPAARAEPVPIDLLGTAGGPVLRRLAPAAVLAAAMAAVLLGLRRLRRRRR
ncbi:MAG: SRPBCC family protein [Actinomycetota bacterium]|nr:SRPBCC family protein [Actinomycetota bacterium]